MNVQFLTGSLSRQGAGLTTSCQSLALSLASQGVKVGVAGEWDEDYPQDSALWGDIPTQAYPTFGPSRLHLAPGLRSCLLKSNADLLHAHGLWSNLAMDGYRWSRCKNRPYMVSAHGMLEKWAMARSRWKKKLAWWLYEGKHLKHAHCLHAVSKQEALDYRKQGLQNPIALIANGVHLPKETSYSSKEKIILFMARIQEKKGILPLIEGWARSKARHQGWKLAIAGWDEGGCEERVKEKAASLEVSEDLLWLGPVLNEKKDNLLRNVSAFILPSYSEGLPMAVLEAWSYGLPVLMSQACNLSCGFEKNAALEAEPNAESIAASLDLIASMSESSLEKIGAQGRKLVEDRFSVSKTASEMKRVYEWLVQGTDIPESVNILPS